MRVGKHSEAVCARYDKARKTYWSRALPVIVDQMSGVLRLPVIELRIAVEYWIDDACWQ